jgi:aquaporin Z
VSKSALAEFFGTFWLVFGGCGSAVLAASVPQLGIGLLGISLAFGLTVLTMAYTVGPISGCHLNPAVSFGLWASRKFPASELPRYVISQVLGSIAASCVLYLIASGKTGFNPADGFGANGYGAHSPGGYSLFAGFVAETVLTFFFLLVILGSTDQQSQPAFAPIAIGLALTIIHLVGIPVTGVSVNPARSTGPALFVGASAMKQLWLFWVAPLLGAYLAAAVWRILKERR